MGNNVFMLFSFYEKDVFKRVIEEIRVSTKLLLSRKNDFLEKISPERKPNLRFILFAYF